MIQLLERLQACAFEPDVERSTDDCPGCTWLHEAITERSRLATELSLTGECRVAQIAEEGVKDLQRSWREHIRRDHHAESGSR